MENQELIINTIRKYFKENLILSNTIMGNTCIRLYLVNNEKESINGILRNDMLNFTIWIGGNFSCECYYCIKPQKNKNLYCEYKKFRKFTNKDMEKFIKSLDRFLLKLKNSIIEDYNNNIIMENYTPLVEKYIINQ